MNITAKYRASILVILAGFLLTTVSGCSYFKGWLSKSNAPQDKNVATTKIPVSTVSSGKIYFQRVSAKYDGNMIVVRGIVGNRYAVNLQGGHIDAKLYGPDDIQIAETSTYQTPRTIHKRGRQHAGYSGSKFTLDFQKKPPEGSRVVLWFHRRNSHHMAMAPH